MFNAERDRQTDRQTEKDRERLRERETETETKRRQEERWEREEREKGGDYYQAVWGLSTQSQPSPSSP